MSASKTGPKGGVVSEKTKKERKVIRFSMCLPVTCEVEVTKNYFSDLEIVAVRRVKCEATPRSINEQMTDDDRDTLEDAFAKAKEIP